MNITYATKKEESNKKHISIDFVGKLHNRYNVKVFNFTDKYKKSDKKINYF